MSLSCHLAWNHFNQNGASLHWDPDGCELSLFSLATSDKEIPEAFQLLLDLLEMTSCTQMQDSWVRKLAKRLSSQLGKGRTFERDKSHFSYVSTQREDSNTWPATKLAVMGPNGQTWNSNLFHLGSISERSINVLKGTAFHSPEFEMVGRWCHLKTEQSLYAVPTFSGTVLWALLKYFCCLWVTRC